MPGEPTVEEVYGRFVGPPSQADLDRFFFLDDRDLALVGKRRGDHNRLGFALQLGTVRFLGTFLADPTAVPTAVADYVAGQVGVPDASCLKGYMTRRSTRFEHTAEITAAYGYRDFATAEAELTRWVDDRAWTTGDGPKALFEGAVGWLRDRRVLLPGVTRLSKLVARVRDEAMQRLWDVLADLVTPAQARMLELLLEVPDGARKSALERLRTGPTNPSGKAMVAALDRVAEVAALGLGSLNLDLVPQRRVVELARWGIAGKAPALRRHPYSRKLATLLATVVYLEARATDDALELFDVLMTNDLMARAVKESKDDKLRRYPAVSRDAARCAAAVGVLFDSDGWGEDVTLQAIWAAIDNLVSRDDLRDAVDNLAAVVPPPDADPGGEWRTTLVDRFAVVRPFVALMCRTVELGATAEAAPVLIALRGLPDLLEARATKRIPAGYLDASKASVAVVPAGWWRPLVFPPTGPRGPCTAPPTSSVCWSSSTSACAAGTSSPPPRHGGPTRGPNCSAVRHGTPPEGRSSTLCSFPPNPTSCSPATPAISTPHGVTSPDASTPTLRSPSTTTADSTPVPLTPSPTRPA